MALKPCRDCGERVSTSARKCEKCGCLHPAVQKWAYKVLWGTAAFAAMLIAAAIIRGLME